MKEAIDKIKEGCLRIDKIKENSENEKKKMWEDIQRCEDRTGTICSLRKYFEEEKTNELHCC